jgi:hypothetical protein
MNNTKNTLLMSVAVAALIAGFGVASAQAPSPPPAAKQSAPAEKMGPALKDTTGQASPETKAPNAAKPDQKASEPKADIKKDKGAQAPAPAAKSTTGQAQVPDSKSKAATGQAPAQDKDLPSKGKTSSDMKADTKTKADAKSDAKSPDKSSEKAGDAKAVTTGQGAAGAAASLSTEQRTTIRTVIKQQNAKPMTNVNFSISVGARVPRTVHFYTVPVELVQIYPSWRGYDYFLVGDQIIVVNPRTHEIVAVLDA